MHYILVISLRESIGYSQFESFRTLNILFTQICGAAIQ